MKNINQYFFITLEVISFCLITLFCFGAWFGKPQQVFSLHDETVETKHSILIQPDIVSVNLPQRFTAHFSQQELNAVRMINDNPDWVSSTLSSKRIEIDLTTIFDDQNRHLLFCYLLSLHQEPTSYDVRVAYPGGRVVNQRSSGILPAGEMMWRDQIGMVDMSKDSFLHLTTDHPGSKAYLCDFVIYDAPGMLFWDGGR